METIRFKGYLSFEDSLRVQQALQPRRRLPAAALITAGTLAVAAVVLWRMQAGGLTAVLLLAFLGTFMAVGFRVLAASARRSQQKVYEQACISRHGIRKPDSIHIKRGQTRKAIPWDHFDRTVAIDGIVAIVTDGEALGFARYMSNTESEWTRARELILKCCGQALESS